MILKLLPFYLLLLIQGAAAQDDELCLVDKTDADLRVQLPGRPSWFISPDPNGESVGVILSRGNYLISLTERDGDSAKKIRVPGTIDPVWTPDGKYLTNPGAEFYDGDKLRESLKDGTNASDQREVKSFDGSDNPYQSVGVLSEKNSRSTYHYISDPDPITNGVSYITVKQKGSGNKLKRVSKGTLCPGLSGHTPMISNDGRYLSVMTENEDGSTTTKIFRTGEKQDECKEVLDLGFPTGKVSFDYSEQNPRRIAFHVDNYKTNDGWFSSPGSQLSKDSYVLDLNISNQNSDDEKWDITNLKRINITNKKGQGTYYPRFIKDGRIIAVEDQGEDFFLSVYNPDNIKGDRYEFSDYLTSQTKENCKDIKEKQILTSYALASLWSKICNSYLGDNPVRFRDALLITPYLNPDSCQKLVDKEWTNLKSEISKDDYSETQNNSILERDAIRSLEKEDLLAACPTEKHETFTQTRTLSSDTSEETDESLFLSKCAGCHNDSHQGGGYQFQSSHGGTNQTGYNSGIEGLSHSSATNSIRAINDPSYNHQMPPPEDGEILSTQERKKITRYLNQFVDRDTHSTEALHIDHLISNTLGDLESN